MMRFWIILAWSAVVVLSSAAAVILSDHLVNHTAHSPNVEYLCEPGYEDVCAEMNAAYTVMHAPLGHVVTYDANPGVGKALQIWGQAADVKDGGMIPTSQADIHVFVDPSIQSPVLGYAGCGVSQCVLGLRADTWDHMGVITHEVGHDLGLGHSTDRDAMMYPYCCAAKLSLDDINGIVSLYGPAKKEPAIFRLRGIFVSRD